MGVKKSIHTSKSGASGKKTKQFKGEENEFRKRFPILEFDDAAGAADEPKGESGTYEPDGPVLEGSTDPATTPEFTLEEIVSALKGLDDGKAAPEKQLEMLTGLGRVLDQAPHILTVGRGIWKRQMTVREYMMGLLLRIRDKHGKLRPLILNDAQREYDAGCGKHSIVLKARQLGITTYVAARFFINCITRPGTLSVQVAHDQRSAEEIFRIVHRMLANLPEAVRNGALKTSRANVRQIVFPALDSEYRVETAADPNAGRGLTIQNLHCSEVARWPRDVGETLASLRAAVPPDGEIALESTPNGASGPFYMEWQNAAETGYTRHFFAWWRDKHYRRKGEIAEFTEEELELMQKHGLDGEQIAFRREIRANFGRRMKEEYAEDAEVCFMASGECLFDIETLQRRLVRVPKPIKEKENARILVFLPPITGENGGEKKEYIIGVDPAGGGTDGDYACAQVIERASGLQCLELRGHYTPHELGARVADLGHEYNDALVAVERNNHGYAVLSHLSMTVEYRNLYRQDGQAGWLTTAKSRPKMLENLASMLGNWPCMFNSPRFLEECRTFVRHPDGSTSATSGSHDDTVMAMGIAQAVRQEMPMRLNAAKNAYVLPSVA